MVHYFNTECSCRPEEHYMVRLGAAVWKDYAPAGSEKVSGRGIYRLFIEEYRQRLYAEYHII